MDNGTLNLLESIGFTDEVEEVVAITDEPKLPSYMCFTNETTKQIYNVDGVLGRGLDIDETSAKIKAVGECLERLCLVNPQEHLFCVSKFDHNHGFLDPAIFDCYAEGQVGNKRKFLTERREGVYKWWPIHDLNSGRTKYIPAQMIFLSDHFKEEIPIRKERISTGAALGPIDGGLALKNGLLEVVERDACISAYLTRRKVKRIVNPPEDVKNLVRYLQRYRIETHVFDVTTDLDIPAVMAITLDYTGIGDAVNVGSKASTNYAHAITSAIHEAIQCRASSRLLKALQPIEKTPTAKNIFTMYDRFSYWGLVERIEDLKFWTATEEAIEYDELRERDIEFTEAVRNITLRNFHIFAADLTLPKLREKGFEVLKVVIPELHPLYLDERAKALYSVHHGEIKEDPLLKPHPIT
ncbi:YcaO-like family protein [Candidatus Woesearchaeota archaeon]|nr:YcaO-like family protein [Candidatus Woesearchaeota archaeon]